MPALSRRSRQLLLAVVVTSAAVVTAAVATHAATQPDAPPWANALIAQVSHVSDQLTQVTGSNSQLGGQLTQVQQQIGALDADVSALDAKLTQVNSRTIDISTDIQLLKQLANSTHDRLTAVCRNVNSAWSLLESHAIPDIAHSADPANCWRNYYAPSYAATFSSRWTDPIP